MFCVLDVNRCDLSRPCLFLCTLCVAQVYIAMEIAGHGDLLEYIKLRGAIVEEKARVMFQQMAEAIRYLHSLDVVHR